MRKKLAFFLIVLMLGQMAMTVKAWDIERPDADVQIYRTVHPAGSTNGEASVAMGMELGNYANSTNGGPPAFYFNVSMTSNTRIGISYHEDGLGPLNWKDVSSDITNITYSGDNGDNSGTWISLPYQANFRYYGVEYRGDQFCNIWVCTNGFISFDISNSTTPVPSAFPSSNAPTAVIAPLWTDLKVDSQSSIVTGRNYGIDGDWFVVTWNNVLHKQSGTRLTFQVALKIYYGVDPAFDNSYQSDVLMSYQQVGTVTGSAAAGLEDQEGCKGYGAIYSSDLIKGWNQRTDRFRDSSCADFVSVPRCFIESLTLAFNDGSGQSQCKFYENSSTGIGGYNVKTKSTPPQEDTTAAWLATLGSTSTLLVELGGIALEVSTTAIWPVNIVICGLTWYSMLVHHQYHDLDVSYHDGDNASYVTAPAYKEGVGPLVTDATLSASIKWTLSDTVTFNHALNVTATVQYCEYNCSTHATVDKQWSTSTTLNVYRNTNCSPISASTVSLGSYGQDPMLWLNSQVNETYDPYDFYKFYATQGAAYWIDMSVPHSTNFDLYLYDGPGLAHQVANSTNGLGQNETIGFVAGFTGYYYIEALGNGGWGFYDMTVSLGAALSVNVCPVPIGAGHVTLSGLSGNASGTYPYRLGGQVTATAVNNTGFVFSYWILDGNYNFSNPVSVTMNTNHTLTAYFASYPSEGGGNEQCPILHAWDGQQYVGWEVLEIHNPTGEDVIRNATVPKALVNITQGKASFMLQEGWPGLTFSESTIDQVQLYAVDIFGNRLPCPLTSAQDSRLGDVWLQLLFSDNCMVQTLLLDRIWLKFLMPYPSWLVREYFFVIEGCNRVKQ